jgi:hypothetical protein
MRQASGLGNRGSIPTRGKIAFSTTSEAHAAGYCFPAVKWPLPRSRQLIPFNVAVRNDGGLPSLR